ncbi:MAG TPA: hypothetical protein VHW09_16855 [Bryobacteraceae bacterium]|nr:hypothetical protein [Bryobacteraceae bacterium]
MKLVSLAAFSIFVGCLCAQTSTQSERQTTTTTTNSTSPVNMEGTLIDQGCYSTHSHSKETTSNPGSTTTTETTKDHSDCPVTTSTRDFALLTPEGKVVHFDQASNGRVVEMMKSDQDFSTDLNEHRPVKVRVVAMPNGDVMVIKDIKPYKQ